jgi:TonB family protein
MSQPAIDRRPFTLRRAALAVARALSVVVIVIFAAAPLLAQNRAAIHKVPPTYPPLARQMRITGTVIVTATVDPAGKVLKAESTSGNKLLAGSAIEAVKQWKFEPANVTNTFPVSIEFQMN